jgi:hypothetical protein
MMRKNALSNQDNPEKNKGEETAESHGVQIYPTMKTHHSRLVFVICVRCCVVCLVHVSDHRHNDTGVQRIICGVTDLRFWGEHVFEKGEISFTEYSDPKLVIF